MPCEFVLITYVNKYLPSKQIYDTDNNNTAY